SNEFVIGIIGGDHITFDGIDIDASAGSDMEQGYSIRNADASSGAHYNTIRNCTVTLNNANINSWGVIVTSSTTGGGSTASSTEGSNSNNLIENVTVENSNSGIHIISGSASWPGDNNQVVNCTVGA